MASLGSAGRDRRTTRGRHSDEPYVAGDEGIGNRRDGPAVEIDVEDRKIEVGFPRRFQRLVDTRGLGGECIAELTYHVREQHADQHVVFNDEELLPFMSLHRIRLYTLKADGLLVRQGCRTAPDSL
jgi:hypothetical protein